MSKKPPPGWTSTKLDMSTSPSVGSQPKSPPISSKPSRPGSGLEEQPIDTSGNKPAGAEPEHPIPPGKI
jgi:hypothetical protein